MIRRLLILISLSLLCVSHAFADDAVSSFRYSAQIKGPLTAGGIYIAELRDDILSLCAQGCRDLRVFGPDGAEVPYAILENRQEDRFEYFTLKAEDFSESEDTITITLSREKNTHAPQSIVISPKNRSYIMNGEVYGIGASGKRQKIGQGRIYDFGSRIDIVNTVLDVKETDHLKYQVVLVNAKASDVPSWGLKIKHDDLELTSMPLVKCEIAFDDIKARYKVTEKVNREFVRSEILGFTPALDDNGDTVIEFSSNVEFTRILLETDDVSYNRHWSLSAASREKPGKYTPFASGVISKSPVADVNGTQYIEVPAGHYSSYRLLITNNRNPALKIKRIHVEHPKKYMVFAATKDAGAYTLRVGNESAQKINYDISSFIREDNLFSFDHKRVEISDVQKQDNYKAPAKALDPRNILIAIVVLIMALMSAWIYRLIRKS